MRFILLIMLNVVSFSAMCQVTVVTGELRASDGSPLSFANVYDSGNMKNVVQTDIDGSFKIELPRHSRVLLTFSMAGFKKETDTITTGDNEFVRMNKILEIDNTELQEVQVVNRREREANLTRINPKVMNSMPGVGLAGVETSLKTQPGVIGRNEFSTQYSVRGGNFDENMVYVNDVMVYRPLLIRSGQQEGLSFVNSDMISSITFSSGGFGAQYGDRMSSVLDIKYKTPTKFGASASVSTLGASGHVESTSKDKRFAQVTGVRYKNHSLVLKVLDDSGAYKPSFGDIQTYMTYRVSDKHTLGFMGYVADNSYSFTPESKTINLNMNGQSFDIPLGIEGHEKDRNSSLMVAVWDEWRITETSSAKFIASTFHSRESEAFDIYTSYYLDDMLAAKSEESQRDSIYNLSTAGFFRHARNELGSQVYEAAATWRVEEGISLFETGVSGQLQRIDMLYNEWVYVDSADYSMPYSDTAILMDGIIYNDISYRATTLGAFAQNTWRFQLGDHFLSLCAGLRASYKNLSKQALVSPRAKLSFKPGWRRDVVLRVAWGYYYQPAFFKEMIDLDGTMYETLKSQKSIHYLVGGELVTRMWGRPFKFTADAYYKDMRNIVPYTLDNVRLQYLPRQTSHGFATGIDLKLNGEFIKGTESWVSVSVLRTREDIDGDNKGYIRRPTDQLVNFGAYFQDFLPWDNTIKFNVAFYHGSNIPSNPPSTRQDLQLNTTIPQYNRMDLGISKQLLSEDKAIARNYLVKNVWVGLEILNAFKTYNVSSYSWIQDVNGAYYPVSNYLTGRLFNLKLTAKI